ncbi:hypothetical protein J3R30DRAFT_3421194 [Lentinula aciculospora]|uniref:Yeast cell wall synthesis Kre9/Knh1-like N-terminal domain-containing protein n=1 Tax=Lentinula aciculospora TaxID=153920 RepID=A0A9W9AWI3_9AGAR|nr:hypothetical protein J3R30DRAFT_3421194 [Lentinula aciculospora]
MCHFFFFKALALALVALDAFIAVQASLYIIQPSQGSICSGGSPCTVQWLDDGTNPLNSQIGVTTCGLYTGDMQLVQTIEPVDVTGVQSFTFTPIPDAGPDSNDYYIAFTSTSLEINGTKYTSYSPFFSLNNMTGSFSSPLASATSSIAIPSSLTGVDASSATSVLSTITVGTITTPLSPTSTPSATASSSRFSTLTSSSASATTTSTTSRVTSTSSSTSSSSASGATSSNGAASLRTASLPLFGIVSFAALLFL